MKKVIMSGMLVSFAACVLVACGAATKPKSTEPDKPKSITTGPMGSTACQDPRPEMCMQLYDPACGYWHEGPVCKPGVPCPAIAIIKNKTYSNSCTACSDPKVKGFKKGACSQ